MSTSTGYQAHDPTAHHFQFLWHSAAAQKRWQKLSKNGACRETPPLEIVQATDDVAETILKVVKQGKFGMVVMGKRGLSGIKRWILGSVSPGVLKGLGDQTLMLID